MASSSHILAQLKCHSRSVVNHGIRIEEGVAGIDVGHVEKGEERPARGGSDAVNLLESSESHSLVRKVVVSDLDLGISGKILQRAYHAREHGPAGDVSDTIEGRVGEGAVLVIAR